LERSDNPGNITTIISTLKGLLPHMPNAFSVAIGPNLLIPRLSLALQPWAEISERLRRNLLIVRIALLSSHGKIRVEWRNYPAIMGQCSWKVSYS
jgi:hypothetical protein